VEEYGGAHANTYAGAYLDSERGGVVVALFAGPTEVHQLALSGLVHPAAQIDVRPARFSLISLQAVEDDVRAAAAQLRVAGIRIGSSTVNVPDNRVWVSVGSLDPSALARVAAIGPSGTIFASWDDFLLAELPRGSLTGRVIDGGGAPLADLEVRLTGDVASYEPDGGVAYSTDGDGRFTIPRLAAMGWSVDVMQTVPDRAVVVVGHVHVSVEAGRPTVITIIASPFSGTTSDQLTTDERVRPVTGYSRIRVRSSRASTQSLGLGG
jgi:hypothetical protein